MSGYSHLFNLFSPIQIYLSIYLSISSYLYFLKLKTIHILFWLEHFHCLCFLKFTKIRESNTHTHTRTHSQIYIHMHEKHAHIYIHTHAHTHKIHIHTYTCTHMHNTHVNTHTYAHTDAYTYIYSFFLSFKWTIIDVLYFIYYRYFGVVPSGIFLVLVY